MKQAIWLNIVLLIIEGGLRRWILPGLATPLLVVRDGVALYLLVQAVRWRMTPRHPVYWLSFFLAGLAFILALTFGHGDLRVALYGIRPFVFCDVPL